MTDDNHTKPTSTDYAPAWQTEIETTTPCADVNLHGSLREVATQWAKTHLLVILALPLESLGKDHQSMVIATSGGSRKASRQMLEAALTNFDTLLNPSDDDGDE